MSRRNGRILAFQALYAYDVGGLSLEELLKFEWLKNDFSSEKPLIAINPKGTELETDDEDESEENDSEAEDFARILIAGTVNHIDEIDSQIKAHLSEKWEIGRINRVSLAVIRLSTYSLLFQKDLAPSIVIDEAVALTKIFGEDNSYKFVNAILDSIRKANA